MLSRVACAKHALLSNMLDSDVAAKEDHVKRIRITSHGKMKGWVAFSLQFLLDVVSNGMTTSALDTNFSSNRKPPTVNK